MSVPTKRSVVIAGRATSVSVEEEFWQGLREMARAQGRSIQQVLEALASDPEGRSLTAAIRLSVFRFCRSQRTPQ